MPRAGEGSFTVVDLPLGPTVRQGRDVTYSLEIEEGLEIDHTETAGLVQSVLHDERGWQTADGVRFVPTGVEGIEDVDIRIRLSTPDTTDELCLPADTAGLYSCFNQGTAALNGARWINGTPSYDGELRAYRTHLINHEVGHGLGHGHPGCPGEGKPAPVMMQQSKGLDGCLARWWPVPPDEEPET